MTAASNAALPMTIETNIRPETSWNSQRAGSLAAAEPYLPRPAALSWLGRAPWIALVVATRALLIFVRAVPEYVWAFILVAIVGPTLWGAVFALAIHNTGILGELNAEAIENLELRHHRRSAASALAPARSRSPASFHWSCRGSCSSSFYRWETCLREATVLGMLGVASLGFFIQDARARQHYDVMLALILVGSAIVLIGDLLSAAAPRPSGAVPEGRWFRTLFARPGETGYVAGPHRRSDVASKLLIL